MIREELAFLGTCDISGQVRGKGVPASDLADRSHRAVGWTPTNVMITLSELALRWTYKYGAGNYIVVAIRGPRKSDLAREGVTERKVLSAGISG